MVPKYSARLAWIKLKKCDAKWAVHVSDLSKLEDSQANDSALIINADFVMVCAGTFGSTELLLHSRSDTLKFSDTLGERFSGNGDVLAFGYNNYWQMDGRAEPRPVYGVGIGANKKPDSVYPGPCITGIIDNRDAVSVKQGRVIEEGVIAGALAMALPPAFFFAGTQYGNFLQYGFEQAATRLKDAQNLGEAITEDPDSLTKQAYQGPVSRTQTYLVMSYDDSGGTLYLDNNNNIRSQWKAAGRSPYILKNNAALREANAAIKGQFISNPAWSEPMDYKLVTVHPLGGCCMSESADHRVVSPHCEVFDGNTGNVHEGLFVLDGSVLPTAAGVNPLLAITAIAEYSVEQLANKNGWEINYDLAAAKPIDSGAKNQHLNDERVNDGSEQKYQGQIVNFLARSFESIQKLIKQLKQALFDMGVVLLQKLVKLFPGFFSPGFSFTETMRGFISDKTDINTSRPEERISNDYALTLSQSRSDGNEISYKLTISTPDLNGTYLRDSH